MTIPSEVSTDLIPAGKNLSSSLPSQLSEILSRAGRAAMFAAEEFSMGESGTLTHGLPTFTSRSFF